MEINVRVMNECNEDTKETAGWTFNVILWPKLFVMKY